MNLKVLKIKYINCLILSSFFLISNTALGFENEKKFNINFLKGGMKNDYYLSGVEILLFNDWKTYWKYPGNAGIKPIIEIEEKTNVKDLKILWPIPQKIDFFDTSFFGFKENFIIPIIIKPENTSKQSFINLKLNLGFCKKICTLENLSIQTNINYFETKTLEKAKIEKFLKRVPKKLSPFSREKIKCKKIDLKNETSVKYEIESNYFVNDYNFAILKLTNENKFIEKQKSETLNKKIVLEAELETNFIETNSKKEKNQIILITKEKGVIIDTC